MKDPQSVFKRCEKKYMLNAKQYEAFLQAVTPYVAADEYGEYTICNIYYDSDEYELIRKSLEKPCYKEKFRVRSYGVPKAASNVFLELKKKVNGVVYKRRCTMEMQRSAAPVYEPSDEKSSQIMNEIIWVYKKYDLKPKAYIGYDRRAFAAKEDEEVRITFDFNIRFRDYDLDLSKGDYGAPLINAEQTLMEIKIPGVMPLWLSRALSEQRIFPTSFSKYGTAYTDYIAKNIDVKGEINCA